MTSGDVSRLEKLVYEILFDPLHDLHRAERELDKDIRRKVYKAIAVGMGAGMIAFIGGVFLFFGVRLPVVTIARGDVGFFAIIAAVVGIAASILAARKMMEVQAPTILHADLYRNGSGIGGPAVRAVSQKVASEIRRKVEELSASELEAARQELADEEDDDEAEDSSRAIPNDQMESTFVMSMVDSRGAHGEFRVLAFVTERDDPLTHDQEPYLIESRGYDGYGPTYLIFDRQPCESCGQKIRTSTTYRVRMNPADLGDFIHEEEVVPPPGVYCYEDYRPAHSGPPGIHKWYCQSCSEVAVTSGRASRSRPGRKWQL